MRYAENSFYCFEVFFHYLRRCCLDGQLLEACGLVCKATPIATTPSLQLPDHLPPSFFARPAELVAPELIGCLMVKRQEDGALLWGVIVETEAYSQGEPACHGYRRRTLSNETLFGEPGRFYVYVSYGIHHCVNVEAEGRHSTSEAAPLATLPR